MSEIKVGDLVAVTRPSGCCGTTNGMGLVFVVGAIRTAVGHCPLCGEGRGVTTAAFYAEWGAWCAIERLTKIDPPPVAEDVPAVEEMTA